MGFLQNYTILSILFISCTRNLPFGLASELQIFPFVVKSRLEGKALDFIGSREFSTWTEIKNNLLTQFGKHFDLQCLNFELCHFKQCFNEKPINFMERGERQLIRISKVIKYDPNLVTTEKPCLNNFHNKTAILTSITGLKEPLCQMLRALNPGSLVQIKQILNDYENQQFFKQTNSNFSKLNIKDHNKVFDNSGVQRSLPVPSITNQSVNPPIKIKNNYSKCTFCNKYGHKVDTCFRKNENIVHSCYVHNLTKSAQAYIVNDKTPETIINKLKVYFSLFGIPKRIMSDHGGEFKNKNK